MDPSLSVRPYQVFFEHRPGYLYAYVHSDKISYEIAEGYWIEILTMLRKRKFKRLFLERDIPAKLSAHHVFDLVSNLAHSRSCDISFAMFDHYYDPERSRFEEMVGTNRGLRMRIGCERKSLERWLMCQPASPEKPHVPLGEFAFMAHH